MSTLSLSVQKIPLHPPALSDLLAPLTSSLTSNFHDVSVSLTRCPDLRRAPHNLATRGLSGSPRIADIGGQSHLAPLPNLDKQYSLLEMTRLMEMGPRGSILGAAAGPFHVLGYNSELVPDLSYDGDEVVNRTYCARVDVDEKEEGRGLGRGLGRCVCEPIASTDCGLMANLFGSDGSPGEVLKITAKIRTGELNFTGCVRKALRDRFGEKLVSLGGVFVIKKGKAKLHVMPDFSRTPLNSREEVEQWLKFYDMEAPLVCLSVFHSCDPGYDLRIEHTHCFSDHNQGGHYHDDTTPAEVEYEAYFNTAEVLYRIDRPINTGAGS